MTESHHEQAEGTDEQPSAAGKLIILFGPDPTAVADPPGVSDAHYGQVRRAVGRGAPTVLFGTSTRSLERSLAKLIAEQQGKPAP